MMLSRGNKAVGLTRDGTVHAFLPFTPSLFIRPRRQPTCHAVVPGADGTSQRFTGSDGYDSGDVPMGLVQQMEGPAQRTTVIAILGALGASTNAVCVLSDPASWAGGWAASALFGVIFVGAGSAHFKLQGEFESMVPSPGAWGGLWALPGSDSFHVKWTGVAEILGGAALLLSLIEPVAEIAPWLRPAAALSLFWLVVAVTPGNVFMATHNAPGPGPKGVVLPLAGHVFRWVMQVALLSSLWGVFEASRQL